MVKKAYIPMLLALLFSCGPMAGKSHADDLERRFQSELQETKTIVLQAGAKLRAGGAPTAEMVRLKSLAQNARASHLLMQERFRQQGEMVATLGTKAVERQHVVVTAYDIAIEEYFALVDVLPPDGAVSPTALDALATLLDKIIPRKKYPLLGTLPYKNLGYPAREPATLPSVVPAYKGGNRTVTPADTAASVEAPVSKEITALAQSLNWNPVLIYEWVKNNVETEWYWGVMKGAEETLSQKSGNDADQAALLTALLRASGFPTRFVRGTTEFFPDIDKVKNLLGVEDPIKIANFFQKAGIAFKPVIAGGKIANFQVEHIWVESQIPYSNYRGAVIDNMGKTWLGLDTSIKAAGYARNVPVDVPDSVTATIRDDYLQALQDQTPLEFLKGRVGDYLGASLPGMSWQDLLASRTLTSEVLNIIPASLQFRQVAITGEYTELPAELRHQMTFTGKSGGSDLFTITLDVMRLSNRKVVLTYEPETVEDQQIIDSYGGLDTTPSYLVRLRPVLKVDGERLVVAQNGLPMGADYILAIDVVTPNGTETVNSAQIVGNLAVIGIVGQKANAVLPIAENDDAEGILFKETLGYIDRWNKAEDELAAFLKVSIVRPVTTVVTVGGLIDVTYLLDIPHGFEWKGLFLDAALRGIETVTHTGDETREQSFLRLSALQGSILENRIFEDDFQAGSVSTAKLLQLAAANGTPLITIDKTNIDAVLPPLLFDDAVNVDIANAVHQDLAVKIPQTAMTYLDWSGIGYVKENPETGASGWMLSGMVAGGMTALTKDKWESQDPVYKLSHSNSPAPNKDPKAVMSLRRMTDYLHGTAGKIIGQPLEVVALDDQKHPVQNVPVTFRVVAGGGTVQGVKKNGTTVTAPGTDVTINTENDGIARVKLILGEHTSDSPYYVYAVPNSILVGQNLVSASTPKGGAEISMDKPMEALGYPGDTVALVKVAPERTDNVQGHVNTYSGPVWVKAVDQFGNPVSNKAVTFATGEQQSLWDPPLDVGGDARLFENPADCPGIATQTGCEPKLFDSIEKYTDSSGVFVSVVLGNTDNTSYPIIATAKKDVVKNNVERQETDEEVTVTFNHSSYPVLGGGSGGDRSYLAAIGLQHIDEKGNRIDAGLTGVPMTTPLETMLFLHEEIDRSKGAFITKPVLNGEVTYTAYEGEGKVTPSKVTVPTNGAFATILTPGLVAGPNRVSAQASATVELRNAATPTTLTNTTFFSIWGVKPDVVPDQVVYINKYGYPEADVKLAYTINPASYKGYSQYLVLYEDGATMGFIPTANGYALLSQGGAKFDIRKKYTMQLVLNSETKQEIKSAVVPLNVSTLCLIPDYDHNRKIDQADRKRALSGDTYYFWVNDDDDSGDISVEGIPGSGIPSDIPAGTAGTDIPGSGNRVADHAKVGGTRDLVDWFPVHIDLDYLLATFGTGSYTYKLKHEDGYLDFVMTGLGASNAGEYLTGSNGGIEPALSLGNASTVSITPGGHVLSDYLLQDAKNGKTVIMVEAWKATKKPLVLEIADHDGKIVFTSSLRLSIDGVEQMFRHKNLTMMGVLTEGLNAENPDDFRPTHGTKQGELDRIDAPNFPDSDNEKGNFVFVHGYNVNGQEARGWQAEMFKRMYWSGLKAKFWAVTWYGWDTQVLGVTRNYHVNVVHAHKTASALKDFLYNVVKGDITIAAHSLGNMLVSTTLNDWSSLWSASNSPAKVRNFFLIDAAVAIEAYDGAADKSLDMTHSAWKGYKPSLLGSEWYILFKDDIPEDHRSKLTWRDRFASRPVGTNYYNFFSSGEQVLETHPYTDLPDLFDVGIFEETGKYTWALQEKLKGRMEGPGPDVLGSRYHGWGFNLLNYPNEVSNTALANNLDESLLKTVPLFRKGSDSTLYETGAAGSTYAASNMSRLLAEAIPALTLPAGANKVEIFIGNNMNFDMQNEYKNDSQDWPAERNPKNWLHSDIREIAYPYIVNLFDKFVSQGGLK